MSGPLGLLSTVAIHAWRSKEMRAMSQTQAISPVGVV
jgi:hypothetical protein